MTAAVTLQKMLVFHRESSLKGLVRPWRSWLMKQCHLQWITLPLNVRVGVCVSACLGVCSFVCMCVLICDRPWVFQQSHPPIIISGGSQQNNVSQSQGRLRQMCGILRSHVVCCAITL